MWCSSQSSSRGLKWVRRLPRKREGIFSLAVFKYCRTVIFFWHSWRSGKMQIRIRQHYILIDYRIIKRAILNYWAPVYTVLKVQKCNWFYHKLLSFCLFLIPQIAELVLKVFVNVQFTGEWLWHFEWQKKRLSFQLNRGRRFKEPLFVEKKIPLVKSRY